MLANRILQAVINTGIAIARTRPTPSPTISRLRLRYYSTSDRQSSEQQRSSFPSLRGSVKLAGIATTVFIGYIGYVHATSKNDDSQPSAVTGIKDASRNQQNFGYEYVRARRSLNDQGLFLWGSNRYGVVDPESKDTIIKTPRELLFFYGQVLRGLKVNDSSAAAITEQGDLVQWGKAFSETDLRPAKTLVGKNLVSISMSSDRIIALASNGNVYSLPIAKADQEAGRKVSENSWLPFWSRRPNLSYRLLNPALKLGEKVTAISGGQEHVLLLTNFGRVFSAASATEHYPSYGQLGIPGLT